MTAVKPFLYLGLTVMFAAMPSSFSAQDRPATALTPEQAREEEAYTIGVQAYIYGYPLVEMYRVRYARVFDPTNENRACLNQFSHGRRLRDHTDTQVVFPNNDTLYSSAFLDLGPEPVILHIPDTHGRYHVFQFMDFYTNNIAHVRNKATDTRGSNFAVVGPGWKGTLPEGLTRIDSPTKAVWLLGRTLVDGKEDLPAVHLLQDQYTLTGLSAWSKKQPPSPAVAKPEPPAYDRSEPLKFFEFLNAALRENPPPDREAALISLFGRVGVGTDKRFMIGALDPTVAKGLRRAINKGRQIIVAAPVPGPKPAEGWAAPLPHIGRFGDDYLYRAVVANTLLAALSPEEAIYFQTYVDAQRRRLSGEHRYVIRLQEGQLPPVDAFWSLTVYRAPEGFLAANALDRYSIGDRTKGLKYGPDGSLEVYIQQESPGADKESNWLPTPKGAFYLGLRCYLPRQAITGSLWKPPSAKRRE